jgi:hypothetical protein
VKLLTSAKICLKELKDLGEVINISMRESILQKEGVE